MKKYLPFVFLLFLVLGCPLTEDGRESASSLSLGDTHDFDGIVITFVEAFWLEKDPIWTPLENAIGIEVRIKNELSDWVDYAERYYWGGLIDNNGNQIDNVSYSFLTNATIFSGSSILPGATITDTITFDEYTGSPTSFAFIGEPPVYEDYWGPSLCYPFELSFDVTEVKTKP
jgi:hypothetical protein